MYFLGPWACCLCPIVRKNLDIGVKLGSHLPDRRCGRVQRTPSGSRPGPHQGPKPSITAGESPNPPFDFSFRDLSSRGCIASGRNTPPFLAVPDVPFRSEPSNWSGTRDARRLDSGSGSVGLRPADRTLATASSGWRFTSRRSVGPRSAARRFLLARPGPTTAGNPAKQGAPAAAAQGQPDLRFRSPTRQGLTARRDVPSRGDFMGPKPVNPRARTE